MSTFLNQQYIGEQTCQITLLLRRKERPYFSWHQDSLANILALYLMWPVCFKATNFRRLFLWFFFSCFWIELPLIKVDANGRSNDCVIRLTTRDTLAHLWLLYSQKDVWDYRKVRTECLLVCAILIQCMFRWVCLSLCGWKTGLQRFLWTAAGVLLYSWCVFFFLKCCQDFQC